ncbi:helix-turn-helix transcriptional regulator [Nostoc sp. UCD121]|uniref:helix-turn-helix domain-containing protein n=1 Tax=unclassified Nostoc TaxID=2593658 RepID=UPI001623A97F|nr:MULTISPECIES: helix-turn-helix transcriptional regulator [unclassified Nostoc]MBC1220906.1 helix-turn-helix transcriptional regulator [Nostoc sp. UCD120]MBC1277376.1 helix-turn-helix transcriptional regulator [Nostoc sp. UCD121]MBC1294349.1 helix-turn-helix transcriptional regulator [Nostoc sp. UCD122]
MTAIKQPSIALLVRETRQCLKLSQVKLATMLGVSFHTVNRWENGRTRPSPLAMKQIEKLLYQMGEPGKALLTKYF